MARDPSTGDQLFETGGYKPPAFNDFAGLPEKVYPLSLRLLEQGGDLLFYRDADLAKGITWKQNAIFWLLIKIARLAEIDITVMVVTGVSGGVGKTARTLTIYDYMGVLPKQPPTRPATTEEIQSFIQRWFNERKQRR